MSDLREWAHIHIGGKNIMNKKLLALLAVAAMGISIAGATPQTQFNKGEFQLDLGASAIDHDVTDVTHDVTDVTDEIMPMIMPMAVNRSSISSSNGTFDAGHKWNFDGGLTYALGDKTALQYAYHGLNVKEDDELTSDNKMHEVNVIQSLNKNFAVYGGWGRLSGDDFEDTNNIAQLGVIAKANLTDKLDIYGKAAVGTKSTTIWEAGLGYGITEDLDLSAGYRYINTEINDDQNASFKGAVVGLSYRFGGSTEEEPMVTPAPVCTPAPVVEQPVYATPKLDYYVQSIHFDVDQDVPRADQKGNLEAMVTAANAYPTAKIKLLGNTDSDASSDYNQKLSERRVQNVAQYAVNNGISADRLVGIANGENKPASTNDSALGKANNRRVDVYVNR